MGLKAEVDPKETSLMEGVERAQKEMDKWIVEIEDIERQLTICEKQRDEEKRRNKERGYPWTLDVGVQVRSVWGFADGVKPQER